MSARETAIEIRVETALFDASDETRRLVHGRTDIGAVVSFTGLCRDEGGALAALEIEHYPGMAEAEIGRVADEARTRWDLSGLTIVHRYGLIRPGDPIVLVVVASRHRTAALEAAHFLMDYLKTHAPFWKKEHWQDGRQGGWVEARQSDVAQLARWSAEGG